MLFETIINKIKTLNNFEELSDYITSEFLYNRVTEYLNDINLRINPKIILASFILKYEIENNLYYPYNNTSQVFNIVDEINKLHQLLTTEGLPSNLITEGILYYIKKFNIWKDEDKKQIIETLKEDYLKLNARFKTEQNEIIKKEILLLLGNYKSKLLKLISEEDFNEFSTKCPKETFDVKKFMKNSYNTYVTNKLKDNDFEIVTKNLVELREYILRCTTDPELIKDIIDTLYIEYLSDEELFKFIYNFCELIIRIINEDDEIKLTVIADIKKSLNKNVTLDVEMYKFIPDILDSLYNLVEEIIIEKNEIFEV